MRIFVTGATGFIGAHFIERALDAGHTVTGLYRSNDARHRAVVEYLHKRGATLARGDILKVESFADALQDSDCICHFAAAFREPGADQSYFDRINVEGTANVVNAAAERRVKRFVHCSTAGIYGQRVSGVIDERNPIQPWNSYERSKLAAEHEVRRGARAAGTEYVILRPTAVYGPRDERLLKLFRSVSKGRFPLFGRGEGRRHMIYVTDLAEAFLRACTAPSAANQELIVAGPEAVPLRDMLQTLAHAANRRVFGPRLPLKPMLSLAAMVEDVCGVLKVNPPIYRRRMDFYLNDAAFDSTRAQTALGWRPKVNLAEGLAATLRASRQADGDAAVASSRQGSGEQSDVALTSSAAGPSAVPGAAAAKPSLMSKLSMKRTRMMIAAISAMSFAIVATDALAHHGWSGYGQKLQTLRGTIEESSYVNPHGTATVKTEDKTWNVILAPTARMQSRGLTREMLEAGTQVTVEGYAHQTDEGELRAERITIDGKTVELR